MFKASSHLHPWVKLSTLKSNQLTIWTQTTDKQKFGEYCLIANPVIDLSPPEAGYTQDLPRLRLKVKTQA